MEGVNCCGVNDIFNNKEARKQIRRYRKRGPRKTSRLLIEGIAGQLNGCRSLLDIGAGIGAVHLELMKRGIVRVTDVDASSAYLELAKEESKNRGFSDVIMYRIGDFVEMKEEIAGHDVVVLDKVICCYPEMDELLKASIERCNLLLALVYPKSNLMSRLIVLSNNFFMKLRGIPFRSHLHDNEVMRNQIAEGGLVLKFRKTVYPWNIEVYKRKSLSKEE